MEKINLILKVDNHEKKMTNALKRNVKNASNEKEKFEDIFRKCVWKKVQIHFFSVEFCHVTHLQHLKSFVGQ